MQPYRQTKPHAGGDCPHCVPTAPGHQMCQHDGCDEIAETQHKRHATEVEYVALPEAFRPIDGVAHQTVFTCGNHEPDPICSDVDHQAPGPETPQPAPCPECLADPGQPCTKANGKARNAAHNIRATFASTPTAAGCDHVHREDCGGQDACQCTPDDTAPERPKRTVEPTPPPGPAPIHMPTHGAIAELLTGHGIDFDRVLTLDIQATIDGHAIHAVMAVLDNHGHHRFDDHGKLLTEEVDVPFELVTPTTPAKI